MRHSTRFYSITAVAVLAATLAACSSQPLSSPSTANYPSTSYPTTQYPASTVSPNYVEYGRVTNVQVVQNQAPARTSGAGAVIGGIAGGVVGNQIGGGSGRDVARIAGIAGGAIAGNAIEKNRAQGQIVESYRISVQTDNGQLRAYDLASNTDLRAGDRVRIENGQLFRY